MFVENLPWKKIKYKKLKMTIMSKLWWCLWEKRWNIFVLNTTLIIIILYVLLEKFIKYQKCQVSIVNARSGIIYTRQKEYVFLLVMTLHMFSTQTYESWTYDRSLVPVVAINIDLWLYILDQWPVIGTYICTVVP